MKRNIRIFYATIVLGMLVLLAMLLGSMVFASPAIPLSGELTGARVSQPSSPMSGHWVVVNVPNVGTGDNSLKSVTGNTSNDVTSVGSYTDASFHEHTLVEHWNGTAWSVVPSQDPDTNLNRLNSVARDMSGGYWAAGTSFSATYGSLIERQITPGGPWSLVGVPSVPGLPVFNGISADSPTDAWAVGDHSSG